MKTKYYTNYITTNAINGKIYCGAHVTYDLDDDYLGSGKFLKLAIEKYGAENFTKKVTHISKSKEEMYLLEAEIVDETFLKRKDTYNGKLGGEGGWDYINSLPRSKEFIAKSTINWGAGGIAASKFLWDNDPIWSKNMRNKLSEAHGGKKYNLFHIHDGLVESNLWQYEITKISQGLWKTTKDKYLGKSGPSLGALKRHGLLELVGYYVEEIK